MGKLLVIPRQELSRIFPFLFFSKFNVSLSDLFFLGFFFLSPPPLHRPVSQSAARRRHLFRHRSHQDPPLLRFHQLLLATYSQQIQNGICYWPKSLPLKKSSGHWLKSHPFTHKLQKQGSFSLTLSHLLCSSDWNPGYFQ